MLEELASEDACKKNGEVCASARVCAAATGLHAQSSYVLYSWDMGIMGSCHTINSIAIAVEISAACSAGARVCGT